MESVPVDLMIATSNMGICGKKSEHKNLYFLGFGSPIHTLLRHFFKKKFQVKVVKVGCALTNVKSAPTKFERQKVFFPFVTYMHLYKLVVNIAATYR